MLISRPVFAKSPIYRDVRCGSACACAPGKAYPMRLAVPALAGHRPCTASSRACAAEADVARRGYLRVSPTRRQQVVGIDRSLEPPPRCHDQAVRAAIEPGAPPAEGAAGENAVAAAAHQREVVEVGVAAAPGDEGGGAGDPGGGRAPNRGIRKTWKCGRRSVSATHEVARRSRRAPVRSCSFSACGLLT